MDQELKKLSELLLPLDLEAAEAIQKLSGRYTKNNFNTPIQLQPAFKYIMYLKLMRGIDDATFHYMKRKYMDTSPEVQRECQEELDKVISRDALSQRISSATIRQNFYNKLKASSNLISNWFK